MANSLHAQAAAVAGASAAAQKAASDHALASGFSHGYLVSAGIMLLALIVTVAAIRVRRGDLAGVTHERHTTPLPTLRQRTERASPTASAVPSRASSSARSLPGSPA